MWWLIKPFKQILRFWNFEQRLGRVSYTFWHVSLEDGAMSTRKARLCCWNVLNKAVEKAHAIITEKPDLEDKEKSPNKWEWGR